MKRNRLLGSAMCCSQKKTWIAGISTGSNSCRLLLSLLLAAFINVSYSQVKVVSGTVSDSTGLPVQGASVTVKGSKIATATGADGTFSLSVPANNSTLIFSYVGMERQELALGSRSTITVTLNQISGVTQEVVVVGYGTQRKATLTGSVSTVNAKTFQDRGPVSSPLAALQGQVPGVTVTRSSSQPGREGWSFLIRGKFISKRNRTIGYSRWIAYTKR